MSKYARNQASGFLTYNLKKGVNGFLFFQKKSRGPFLGLHGLQIYFIVNKINTSRVIFYQVTFEVT
jgi:hypothetical protein